MGRRDYDAVSQMLFSAPVPGQDGVRDGRRRRISVSGVDAHLDRVGRQHFEGRAKRRQRQGVGITADEQWAVGPGLLTVAAGRLDHGQDVVLVERSVQRRTAVSRGPERDPLTGDSRIGLERVIRVDQSIEIDQLRGVSGLPGAGINGHE